MQAQRRLARHYPRVTARSDPHLQPIAAQSVSDHCELARWVNEGGAGPEPDDAPVSTPRRQPRAWLGVVAVALLTVAVCGVVAGVTIARS